MLGDKTAFATVAVRDTEKAKSFYEGTLGLTQEPSEDPGGLMYKCGDSHLFVYKSDYAGSNKATSVSWNVGSDFDAIIEQLQAKGAAFETYEIPGVEHQGPIHKMGDLKAAWFKDPDGNILSLVSR